MRARVALAILLQSGIAACNSSDKTCTCLAAECTHALSMTVSLLAEASRMRLCVDFGECAEFTRTNNSCAVDLATTTLGGECTIFPNAVPDPRVTVSMILSGVPDPYGKHSATLSQLDMQGTAVLEHVQTYFFTGEFLCDPPECGGKEACYTAAIEL